MPPSTKRNPKQKNKWASSCTLASVDPIGVKTVPPEILLRERIKRGDIGKLVAVPPFDRLPRMFIPRSKCPRRPPRMHYGWHINESKLMEYAEQNGCIRSPDVIEASDENGEEEYEISPGPIRVDEVGSMSMALCLIGEKLSPSRQPTLRLGCAINTGDSPSPLIVSIYSNYDLDNVPSDAFIDSLRTFLGETEKPRWFIDDYEALWRPWD